jgi:hypothetical protein
MNAQDIIALFCDIDDFCKLFIPAWHRRQLTCGERKQRRTTRLTASEMMILVVHFISPTTVTSRPTTCSMCAATSETASPTRSAIPALWR